MLSFFFPLVFLFLFITNKTTNNILLIVRIRTNLIRIFSWCLRSFPELSDFPKNLRSLPEKKSVEKATESVLISSINLSVMNDYIFERKKHY